MVRVQKRAPTTVTLLEKDVLKAVWNLLQTRFARGHWDRVSSPAKIYKGRLARPKNVGMADIVGCLYGAYIAIECKAPGVKLRNDQQAQQDWAKDVERATGIYIIARGPEDVIAVLEEME